MTTVNKTDLTTCADRVRGVRKAVAFPPETVIPEIDAAAANAAVPVKTTLVSLQTCINALEQLFSGNCDCLVNTDCCQACQSASCQSQYCQACQGCQTCQKCQSQCTQCNCACNNGS